MKNLYIFLFLLLGIVSFGQNLQNANWIFGSNNWVNFNSNPSNVSIPNINGGAGLDYLEGCASVSDRNGVLLFVTDGKSVYQNMGATFELITDQLLGNYSSAQNVIIVPKPNNSSRYYVFTIDGATGDMGGLYYTELDFSGSIGIVVSGTLNVPLRDNNNVPIDTSILNKSEGITSTIHSNCTDYWVLVHATRPNNSNTGRVFSYQVTENGVINNMPSQSLDFNITHSQGRYVHSIKISPNTNRIAFGLQFGGIFLGDFNNTTGVVNLPVNPMFNSNNQPVYGIEFSPNSNVLYFTLFQDINNTPRLRRVDLVGGAIETINNNDRLGGMQLGIDNRIYITGRVNNSFSNLIVIPDPNNIGIPLTLINSFGLTNSSNLGLPQWVWRQECCLPILTLQSPIDDMNNNSPDSLRERSDWIKATNVIGFGNSSFQDGVVYHAGNYVELNPGFEAIYTSQFSAYIEGCSGNFTYKNGNNSIKDEGTDFGIVNKKISIYPNPTNSYFTVGYTNEKFNNVKITSLEGRVIFNQNIQATNSCQLDISNFKNGIYTVSIETLEGTVITDKLIKK